jgi:hypothetical protein
VPSNLSTVSTIEQPASPHAAKSFKTMPNFTSLASEPSTDPTFFGISQGTWARIEQTAVEMPLGARQGMAAGFWEYAKASGAALGLDVDQEMIETLQEELGEDYGWEDDERSRRAYQTGQGRRW